MAETSPGLPWHPNLKRADLDNGLKIVMLQNQYPKDRFYMYLDVNVGSICEEENEQGVAHFLEHLVFLGTEKWRTPDEMREVMAGLGMSFGGDTNASTDQKNTVYTCEAPAGREQVELVTEILYQVPCHVVPLGMRSLHRQEWVGRAPLCLIFARCPLAFVSAADRCAFDRCRLQSEACVSAADRCAFAAECQMAFRALLPEDCVNSERAPILSEKQMRNTIGYRRSCKMMQMMHGHNILPRRLPIGLEEQIKTFTSGDLRKFYKKWYYPSNMTLYIAGVFEEDEFMEAVKKLFGAEPRRAPELVPAHPEIVHTYARPEGERVRSFLHDLQVTVCVCGCSGSGCGGSDGGL